MENSIYIFKFQDLSRACANHFINVISVIKSKFIKMLVTKGQCIKNSGLSWLNVHHIKMQYCTFIVNNTFKDSTTEKYCWIRNVRYLLTFFPINLFRNFELIFTLDSESMIFFFCLFSCSVVLCYIKKETLTKWLASPD